jgi:hypothetical protein
MDEPPDKMATGVPLIVTVDPPADNVCPSDRTVLDPGGGTLTVVPPTVICVPVLAADNATVEDPMTAVEPDGSRETTVPDTVMLEPGLSV